VCWREIVGGRLNRAVQREGQTKRALNPALENEITCNYTTVLEYRIPHHSWRPA